MESLLPSSNLTCRSGAVPRLTSRNEVLVPTFHRHPYQPYPKSLIQIPLMESSLPQPTEPSPNLHRPGDAPHLTSRDGVLVSTFHRHPYHLYSKSLTHIPLMESLLPSPNLTRRSGTVPHSTSRNEVLVSMIHHHPYHLHPKLLTDYSDGELAHIHLTDL